MRWLFCGALLLFVLANDAYADDGTYTRTKDGKTLVWDNHPTAGEAVEWSGEQDKEGYATGQGTVIWYAPARSSYTFVKKTRLVVAGRFSGKMVRGKLEGTVIREDPVPAVRWNSNPERVFHATFVSGKKMGEWIKGRPAEPTTAPSPNPGSPAKEKVP